MQNINEICMIIEGTYPYLSGGVSNWIHQILTNLKEFKFYLIVLLPSKKQINSISYKLPDNVIGIKNIFLQDIPDKPIFLPKKLSGSTLFYKFFNYPSPENLKILIEFINNSNIKKIATELLFSYESYLIIEKLYKELNLNTDFLKFYRIFWSIFVNLSNIIKAKVKCCKIIHPVSTGFAGLLGAILKILNKDSILILTEHGIYPKERELELNFENFYDNSFNLIDFFYNLSKLCYHYADKIIALNRKTREFQLKLGASSEKIEIIPNGINIFKFKYKHRNGVSNPPVLGFLGRIVKIKDIKLLIKSISIVAKKIPNIKLYIAGPVEEDYDYYLECKSLTNSLFLENNIFFLGKVNPVDFYEKIDILVLSSISESQPYVILEAMSCGIPVISVNVGGCDELIFGNSDNIGEAGILIENRDEIKFAESIFLLISDKKLYAKFSKNGRVRVEKFYNEELLFKRYRNIYSLDF